MRASRARLADGSQVASVSAQNERLVRTLRDAREQIVTLKSEVDRLGQPPSGYGVFVETSTTAPSTCSPAAARCASR